VSAVPALPADWFEPAPPWAPQPRAPETAPAPLRRLLRDPWSVGALAVLALVALLSLVVPALGHPARIDLLDTEAPPSWAHPFGTDALGRDVFARTFAGGRVSLGIGVFAALVDLGIGAVWGSLAGLLGGLWDEVLMRAVDVLYGIPFVLVVILLVVTIGPGVGSVAVAIALVNWLGMARLVRSLVLQLVGQDWVLAARALGVPEGRILWRHVVPHLLGPMLAWLSYNVPAAIFTEAFLSYLGLGVQSPATSWGSLVADGAEAFRLYPAPFFFPAAVLSVTLLAFYVLSDGIQAAWAGSP
jgi:oligopeptide transport system permease protein